MKIALKILYALFILALIGGRSFALEPSGLQKKELVLFLEDVNRAIASGESDALSATMPPRLYQEMAQRMQTDIVTLQKIFKEQLQKQFTAELGGYKFDSTHIDYHQATDGTFYALVSTQVKMQTATINFKTLALYEDTKWYLIHGGQKTVQNPVLIEIYPFLKEVLIPPAQQIKQ